jgi:hypothetical protein
MNTYISDQMTLHVLADLDKLAADDDKAVQHVTVDAALFFLVVSAILDLLVVL